MKFFHLPSLLALTLSFGLGTATVSAAITEVSYWRMGETEGAANGAVSGTALDSVGGRTMTLVGGAIWKNNIAASAATHVGSTLNAWFFFFRCLRHGHADPFLDQ